MSLVRIDSNYASLKEAIQGTEAPQEVVRNLALIAVTYLSFDGYVHKGQLVMHKAHEQDIRDFFAFLFKRRFLIHSVKSPLEYDWDDNRSMAANNSSGFNYRPIAGTKRFSQHSFGFAFDVNPLQNPCFLQDMSICPPEARYHPYAPGTLGREEVAFLTERGWTWGGDWQNLKDLQHFEKLLT